jgi:hypothetical protein
MIRYYLPIALLALLLGASDANAQRVPGINRRPTVSPYIRLFNSSQGGMSNYFNFVRPMQDQMRLNQMQMMENRFVQQQLAVPLPTQSGMGAITGGAAANGMLRPGNQRIGQPTAAASYFNYSHYYNVPVNMQQSLGRFGAGAGRRVR